MQPIEQWLLVLADPEPHPQVELPRARLAADDVMRLCLLAEQHGVLPSVWTRLEKILKENPACLLGREVNQEKILAGLEPVRRRLAERAAMAMFLGAETKAVLRRLSDAGTPVIVLKGMDFATRLYAPPSLRPFVDIDLLVRGRDRERVSAAMTAAGYVPRETELKYATGYAEWTWEHPAMPGAMVELHDNLVNSPTLRRGVSVRLEDLPLGPGADGVFRPTPAGLLIIAAVHAAASHSFDKLQHLCDIAQIVRQRAGGIDETELRNCATKTGAEFCLAAGLDLTARTLGDSASAELLGRLALRWPRWRARRLVTPAVVVRSQGLRRAGVSWRRQLLRQMLKSRR